MTNKVSGKIGNSSKKGIKPAKKGVDADGTPCTIAVLIAVGIQVSRTLAGPIGVY